MIICITEIPEDDSPITFFVDIDKLHAGHSYRKSVEAALAGQNACGKIAYEYSISCGESEPGDELDLAVTVPPCNVEAHIELYLQD